MYITSIIITLSEYAMKNQFLKILRYPLQYLDYAQIFK